jgi:hypothetical protein
MKSDGYCLIDRISHHIDINDACMICQSSHRLRLAKQADVDEMLKDMKGQAVIGKLCSPWSSAIMLIRRTADTFSSVWTTDG